MAAPRLRLALEPQLPLRAPAPGTPLLGFGYRLRLPGGPALVNSDPLLGAYGAEVDWVVVEDDEVLQHDSFDPGSRLRLFPEPMGESGFDEAGVRDLDGIRQAGTLTEEPGRGCAPRSSTACRWRPSRCGRSEP